MKTRVVLVFLAMVLVMFSVAFGACAAPAKRTVTPEEGRTLPAEEKAPEEKKAPSEKEKTPEEKVAPAEEEKALGGFCPAVTDLKVSPEGTNSVQLKFTSTFTGDNAGGIYDFRVSTEPITREKCLDTSPILPVTVTSTFQGEPVPGADIFIEQEPDDEPIMADEEDEGGELIRYISGLKLNTTYYFAVWVIKQPLKSYACDKEDNGAYKFTDVNIPVEEYQEFMSNIVTFTTPSTEARTATRPAGTCGASRVGEACTPRDAVADWIDLNGKVKRPCCKDCGEEQVGQYWAHSFTDLTFDGFEEYLSVIDSATLEIHLRNNGENDHLKIGFINASGDSWAIDQQLTYFDVAVGETKTITVDLSDIAGVSLLEDMMYNNFLDVAVGGDSTVYCVQLILNYTCISTEDWPTATGNKGGFAVGGFNAA